MLLMVLLLICLIDIAFTINSKELTTRGKWLIRLPFSVYFGWIAVAAIANATTLFTLGNISILITRGIVVDLFPRTDISGGLVSHDR